MDREQVQVRIKSLLRRAGLAHVPPAVLVCVAAACALAVLFAFVHFWPVGASSSADFEVSIASSQAEGQDGAQSAESAASGADSKPEGQADRQQSIKVDVEGAVRSPGLYELGQDARVGDAIAAAGGLKKGAYRKGVNLAQKIEDGSQVYVPTKKEAAAEESAQAASAGQGASSGGKAGSGSMAAAGDGAKVNLNTASESELQTLPGVGPVLAASIIDYREKSGPFSKVEDLKNVSGIGDTRYERLKGSVCV